MSGKIRDLTSPVHLSASIALESSQKAGTVWNVVDLGLIPNYIVH